MKIRPTTKPIRGWRRILALSPLCIGVSLLSATTAEAWLDKDAADVSQVYNSQDNQFAFYNGPSGQAEWLLNNGGRTTIRIKGYDDPSAFKWDLTTFAGLEIVEAELHLSLTSGSQVHALAAATINADWQEGTKSGSTATSGDSCWRWRSYPDGEWTYPGSDFSTATFGNFGTLVAFGYKDNDTFKQYNDGGQEWIAMKLDPQLIYAMVLDNYGLVVTDPRFGWENGNPHIYSSEQGVSLQPRLLVKTAVAGDTSPPAQISGLTVRPGEWNGEVILSFAAPTDPDASRAFGYDIRYGTHNDFATATRVDRWRIPRPGAPGSTDQVMVEDLTPGTTYNFWVRGYDQFGNRSLPSHSSFTLPATIAVPVLADSTLPEPDPTGKTIATVPGVLNYWGCSELAKVSPLTGSRLVDGYEETGHDDYKMANGVWDSTTNTISLRPVRNQVVGFQLIIERLLPSLTNLSLQATDLHGPSGAIIDTATTLEFFTLHYTTDTTPYPDPAIPLTPPFAEVFSLPGTSNPSGTHQSVWADLYIPRDAVPGNYTGTLTLDGDQLPAPVTINLEVMVLAPVLPDRPTFFLDLNGYGNKWSSEESRYQVFQLCHKHRMVPNTLPYGWSGSWNEDRAPVLAGDCGDRHISDWSEFDTTYGPFFSGAAFAPDHPSYPYHGPGENTGIANFYTTGSEGWPVSISNTDCGYDATSIGGQGHAYWNSLVDAGGTSLQEFWRNSPDVLTAFPASYGEGTREVWRQFAQHAAANGWTTVFQFYLNNKRTYSNTNSLWTLEEQYVADDFRADAWFMQLSRQGWESGTSQLPFQWRIDTSTRWQQNWGQLKAIANLRVQGDGKLWDWRHDRYRRYTEQQPEQRWWYGTGPSRTESLTEHGTEILMHWSHGLDGGLPYWDNYDNNWTTATGSDGGGEATLSLLLSGSNVPGHGSFAGRIATIRMKGMRFGQQLAEMLNLLASQPGWNRNLVTRALSNAYGDSGGNGYAQFGGDEFTTMSILDLYHLHSRLAASLELELLGGDVDGNRIVDLADCIRSLQISTGNYHGPVRLTADVDGDNHIGLAEAMHILIRESN